MKKEFIIPLKEKLISFETAKLAKEKKFDILCEHSFSEHNSAIQENNQNGFRNWNKEYKNSYSRPTQSLLQKWLREVHGTIIYVVPFKDIGDDNNDPIRFKVFTTKTINSKEYKTYEEALEIGLYQALLLI